MEFPQEIEVWYVIPAVRRELAKRLVSSGLSQRQVARKLDVTEAAISQYLSNKRGISYDYPPKLQEAMAKACEQIVSSKDPLTVRREIVRICALMKKEKIICDLHKKHGFNKEGCTVCFD
jgi:uncharacterized protein